MEPSHSSALSYSLLVLVEAGTEAGSWRDYTPGNGVFFPALTLAIYSLVGWLFGVFKSLQHLRSYEDGY